MNNTKKNIDMHYQISEIEKIIYDMDYPLLKNFELDNEMKSISVSCLRIKYLIENDEVLHRKGAN
tara:strand:- start:100 stop:294 length:195 start_codon:yes stop_codon:yes gene_type:complete